MFKFILCVSAKLQIDLKVSFQGLTIDMIAFYICLGITNQQARNKTGFKHLIKLLIETRMPCRIFCQIFGWFGDCLSALMLIPKSKCGKPFVSALSNLSLHLYVLAGMKVCVSFSKEQLLKFTCGHRGFLFLSHSGWQKETTPSDKRDSMSECSKRSEQRCLECISSCQKGKGCGCNYTTNDRISF